MEVVLKIIIIATHSFPIPFLHTGDVVILELANTLANIGHDVSLIAPEGSRPSDKVKLLPMPLASFGKYPPSSGECEQKAFDKYKDILLKADVVHDFSVSKMIADNFYHHQLHINPNARKATISTIMGGPWTHTHQPHNLVGWSESHRDRIIRGATDYEGTPTPDLAGHTGRPIKDAHIVNGGIDTTFYCPTYNKKDYILWMGRWSKVRGYMQAIEIAKANPNVQFVFSGGMPEHEYFEQEKNCAREAIELAKGISNIKIDLLPPDPGHHIYKRKLYQEAKAFLYNVQFGEPFGMMQAESLACGTPVIGTNYGSVPEVIENGVIGYVCENTLDSFSQAISKIDNINPETCREHAVRRFDISVMAQSYLKKYKEILNGNGW